MTETTGEINKAKRCFVEKINNTLNCQPESSKKKKGGGVEKKSQINKIRKREKLQKRAQKYKGSYEATMSNYIPIK